MARLLIQSRNTGRFLVPGDDDQPQWVTDLKQVGRGLLEDMDNCIQIIADHTDFDDLPQVVDLDRLGSFNDYQ